VTHRPAGPAGPAEAGVVESVELPPEHDVVIVASTIPNRTEEAWGRLRIALFYINNEPKTLMFPGIFRNPKSRRTPLYIEAAEAYYSCTAV
jgi:hypothetical protein